MNPSPRSPYLAEKSNPQQSQNSNPCFFESLGGLSQSSGHANNKVVGPLRSLVDGSSIHGLRCSSQAHCGSCDGVSAQFARGRDREPVAAHRYA